MKRQLTMSFWHGFGCWNVKIKLLEPDKTLRNNFTENMTEVMSSPRLLVTRSPH